MRRKPRPRPTSNKGGDHDSAAKNESEASESPAIPAKARRTGFVGDGRGTTGKFRATRDLGYAEGKNISIEWRGAEGKDQELPRLAAELTSIGVDAIVAETYPAILAAKKATSTVPIVMAVSSDPIETEIVSSLSRPGGNITGLTTLSTELNGKRLELLKEAVPGI